MDNPLLLHDALPAFSRITPGHVEPAIDALLADNRAALETLLGSAGPFTWDNLVAPLEQNEDRLDRAWSAVSHLHGVADSDALRAAYNACLPKLTDYATEMGQNEALFRAYRDIRGGDAWQRLDTAQRKVIDDALREFRLSGVELEPAKRDRFRALKNKLATLETRFEENLLDATHAWRRPVDDPAQLRGLPESARALAAQEARRDDRGGWVFTLDRPSYLPVMQYAEDRELRREMYEAYVTRASERGPQAGRWDNGPIMAKILALRREVAGILGFETYAHYSLARKMARTPEEVMEFLEDLARRSRDMAQKEFEDLRRFAHDEDGVADIEAWDVAFYSERLRQQRYQFTDEDLRPYFPAPRVIDGMFSVVGRLFGVTLRERSGVDTWHPDVRYYEILDEGGVLRGGFFVDLYARPHKRGGAWMDECAVRRRAAPASVQLPVAHLVCNFTPPVGEEPVLLTHDEVLTLFHEFGHGLHHLLTLVDYAPVAGINGVPWDAVEMPSQLLENWCWERESLDLIAGHHRTGAPLPDDLLEKMRRARNFQSGMQMVRQLEFALFDFELHLGAPAGGTRFIQEVLEGVRRRVAVVPAPEFNRFQHSFSHIFAGGYAAGYYSYKWAEVLSADAFSKFEESGIFDGLTGRQFLHSILEQGGARDPMDLFIEFRGREPSIEPLLRLSGIEPADVGA